MPRQPLFASSLLLLCLFLQHVSAQLTSSLLITLDLSGEQQRQVVVDKQQGQYLGHPTTVLLEDGKIILAVYPMGHGAGQIVLKKSTDAGLTWSDRQPVPPNWSTSKEVPTIFKTIDPQGMKHLILFSGLFPARLAISENDGSTWTNLRPVGDWGGIVVLSSVVRLNDGRYLGMFHDDGRYFRRAGALSRTMTVYKTLSSDGGLTWSFPEEVFKDDTVQLCEPGIIPSPDGHELAALLRENSRTHHSYVIFSDNEGLTWSAPRELPLSLTGDRHTGKYAPDGRLLFSFREMVKNSEFYGDWVAWVGTYADLKNGSAGQYLVRIMDNQGSTDCGYPGVEILADSTFVLTTYGHWIKNEMPFIVSVRLKLSQLDSLAARGRD